MTLLVSRSAEALQRQARVLESRNRELDAFAGRVAHDLRGPLTTISLSADRLAERLPSDDSAIAILRRGAVRMDELIEDLLALSRIGSQLDEAPCDVARVAASVEEELGPRVRQAGGALRVDVESAEVRPGEGLLRQLLWNLAENALKYRRPEVPVRIEIIGRRDGSGYALRVEDNGTGMSPAEVRRAFEPFFRGDAARALPGTGLGLSIVKRIVEASDGTIAVQSRPDQGTAFALRLSRRKDSTGAAPVDGG